MSKILYITANPKSEDKSFSLTVARNFIEEYKRVNPQDEVKEIEVYDIELPLIDRNMLEAWDELSQGKEFSKLTQDKQKQLARFAELTDEFVSADKYVFVTPLWNFAVPAMMKAYIDTTCVAGKTFKYTEQGAIGLLKNKKALHIQASGSVFSKGDLSKVEHGDKYIRDIMSFIGVTDFEAVFVEGVAYDPTLSQEIKEKAIEQALNVARRF
ncbi:FMN-dependent NADH-azoreductase [Clostridium cavendishii DSM 21758]|uniref:FMN dependent NADH:quinone oxidoreductase n=1 Tax=Clostridium cavendishii DSM 21758 TaxID=1121302 RepID=A0A1M6PE15_9CLOT|nr:FMN-dependent NADH-azoreductase [Clostridium cavendishii]SHK06176.1 FMN-dependent NADH-azoreductase [Clostridium cavendishii DSM 21758]